MQVREKVGKSRFTVFFQWFVALEGQKVGSLKRRVAEPSGQIRDKLLHAVVARNTFRSEKAKHTILGPLLEVEMSKKCTPLWREAHYQVKMYTPGSDHFWKLRCRKSARRCGAKHISNSKCTKHTILGPLLEVEMSKKCTPLWREANFQVKMYKAHQVRTTFGSWDVEKVHAVVARSTFPSQNVQSTPFSDHFWKFRCRKSARRCGAKQISKSKCNKAHQVRTTFGSWDVEKVHAVVARSKFPSQNVQSTPGSDHFWKLRCRKSARRCGREAHFQVKMYKAHHSRTTFGSSDVEKVHAVVARSTFPSQNVQSTPFSDHFWKLRWSKKCTPLWREAHFQVKMHKALHVRTAFDGWDVVLRGRRTGQFQLQSPIHYTTLHHTYTTLH